MAGKSPFEMGEEVPPVFMPQRAKLMLKFAQTVRNSTRLHRKKVPLDKIRAFGAEAREFAQYVHTQKLLMKREEMDYLRHQVMSDEALYFLPEYLYEEA
mmetsp:Transcript_11818/g.19974  ORF Transcript_11818/g.19974 Transcript_11818/m.19974 type:complete len:99 (+) Transcript_11818:200-496(+)|eukprot:CAMPEP_0168625972 /NCGR_PEP_ID=MMETSP0449_2-20121227/10350_1 /TAXON_ID=1082188 /ORGANISM="Strombidium rassoulzadegani, Strain ras09" /LENGTH=98 /DNA_ID=CAMNT_0008667869 /DNA_START=176 /DNA_END=472 /DNA_ORIENTATION=-